MDSKFVIDPPAFLVGHKPTHLAPCRIRKRQVKIMRMVRTYGQIKTSDSIKGFRSAPHSTAAPVECLDLGRMAMAEAKRLRNNQAQQWRAGAVKSNARCGFSLRIGRR